MALYKFKCIDAHTCGNPVRLIIEGGPELKESTMSERRLHFLQEYDWIRTGLMFEPRGHDMMSGSILYPPHNPNNDIGILFIETSGCLPMCGHGTIGTITIAIEKGFIKPKTLGEVLAETPAGTIKIEYFMKKDKVNWVKLINVASYLAASDLAIESTELGELTFDVAYGGNFYAIIDLQENFKGLESFTASKLTQISREIRESINLKYPNQFVHPMNETIRDVSHILWADKPKNPDATARNAVFYGDKAIDRSPCGTGTSARMAQLHAKGKLAIGEEFVHESIIGSTFIGKIEKRTDLVGKEAIVPSIKGWAKIYGENMITIDTEDDPYAFGFQVT